MKMQKAAIQLELFQIAAFIVRRTREYWISGLSILLLLSLSLNLHSCTGQNPGLCYDLSREV